MQVQERRTDHGRGAPRTGAFHDHGPVEPRAPTDHLEVDRPLQPAVKVVGEVVQQQVGHEVVVVHPQDAPPADLQWNGTRVQSLLVDPVAHLLREVPVDLEIHGDRSRAAHRQVMAAADVVRPLGLGRRFPALSLERGDGGGELVLTD